ncbi:phytosulfokines-like [Andrographis paniculata]|uniref:phytosulfokines-like n=1 Tax=Andrographis paniculata TaxID=175694 RepID=UPI0021E7097B|nr:phytosulfokines-like [Andrographis paniculata]
MSKPTGLFLLALLLFFSVCSAGRRTPAGDLPKSPGNIGEEDVGVEESCKGIGEDECLMRRSLNAHLDYIYTQSHNP